MTEQKKPYKWIDREIESLDPYKDYPQIFRLSMSYGGNDFINTLMYSLIFPSFIVTEWGARAIWREDGGKVLNKPADRVEQTENRNAAWWWYGPHDPRTKQSVESINKLHSYWAKHYKGDFSHNDDYIYTLASTAVFMHRLRLQLGLPGVTDNVKTASFLVMRDMAPLFRAEGGNLFIPFRKTGMACSNFGNLCANALYDLFAFRFFPKPLRWFRRSVPIALSLPTTLRAHRIKPVNPMLKALIIWVVSWIFWLQDNVFPDPQVAFIQRLEGLTPDDQSRRRYEIRKVDKDYGLYFANRHSEVPAWGGCPYHEALKVVRKGGFPATEYKME
ncbi:hypothetical protein MRS44_013748 [Fusarium solani]|uniref:uncharacterized protein n=1 Tax=Fusarium solani TaxID=169388 RepID=UPI0032C3D7D0|nr:hypothetical protein MRS44_013748 [Fusarium solani]